MKDIHELFPDWGDWTITGQLGKGSHGEVCRVRSRKAGVPERAVKRIHVEERQLLNALEQELSAARAMEGHPNFVQIYDVQVIPEADGTAYDVLVHMELLTGLREWLMSHPLSMDTVIRLGTDICCALGTLEGEGVTHGNVKPSNILVDAGGSFKLGGLGLVRALGGISPAMAAPEQRSGEGDSRSDLYSLGLVLYRLLNGNRDPFLPQPPAKPSREDAKTALFRRLEGEPLPMPAHGGNAPELVDAVLYACSYMPEERFQTAMAFRRALDNARPQQAAPAYTQAAPAPAYAEPAGKKKGWLPILLICLGVVAAALVIILLLLLRGGKEPETPVITPSRPTAAQPVQEMETPVPVETPAATPTPTAAPEPTSEPMMEEADFDYVEDLISGQYIGVSYYETASGQTLNAGQADLSMACSALVNVPVLYAVMDRIDSGLITEDTYIPYTNSGGRGSNGRLAGYSTGSQVKIGDLIYDMLRYSSNSAGNTLINYLGTSAITNTCSNAGYDSVRVDNLLGQGDNYASPEDLVGMLAELWEDHRSMLEENFKITSSDANSDTGLTASIPSSVNRLNHNGLNDHVFAEAAIYYGSDSDEAQIVVFIGSSRNYTHYTDYAKKVGSHIAAFCG